MKIKYFLTTKAFCGLSRQEIVINFCFYLMQLKTNMIFSNFQCIVSNFILTFYTHLYFQKYWLLICNIFFYQFYLQFECIQGLILNYFIVFFCRFFNSFPFFDGVDHLFLKLYTLEITMKAETSDSFILKQTQVKKIRVYMCTFVCY